MKLSSVDRDYLRLVNRLGPRGCVEGTSISKRLRLFSDGRYEVYYAPLGERLSANSLDKARVFFIGITPGKSQAIKAFKHYFDPDPSGRDSVSFEGSMRTNLVRLMDGLGLPKALRITSTRDLFESPEHRALTKNTSLLKYPVFLNGRDYGGSPSPLKHPFLLRMIDEIFLKTLSGLNRSALIVPLGKCANNVIHGLVPRLGGNMMERVLLNFPHTSGSNNGGIAVYTQSTLPALHRKQIRAVLGC